MYYLIFMEEDGFQIKKFYNTCDLSSYIQEYFPNRNIVFCSDFSTFEGRYMTEDQMILIQGKALDPTPVTIVKSWEF